MGPWLANVISYRTAIFSQVNKGSRTPIMMRWNTRMRRLFCQQATVLQIAAEPQKAQEAPTANRAVERELAEALRNYSVLCANGSHLLDSCGPTVATLAPVIAELRRP